MVPERGLKSLGNLSRAARAATDRHGENQALTRAWDEAGEALLSRRLSKPPASPPNPRHSPPGPLIFAEPAALAAIAFQSGFSPAGKRLAADCSPFSFC
jgi:hypothetical protein